MRKEALIYIYITNPSEKVAQNVAESLLKKKLIACANIFGPVKSLYPWKGKLAREKEWVLIGKTTVSLYEKARKEIERVHPYKIPCIIRFDVEANAPYAGWLLRNLR